MKLTAMEEYGLRCLVQLTRAHHRGEALSIPEIAELEGLSNPYAGKIMAKLRSGGLVTAERGRTGGYTLSRAPQAITLNETLSVLGGRIFTGSFCETHGPDGENCIHAGNCTLRPVWGVIEMIVGGILKQLTLESLLESERSIRETLSEAVSEEMQKHAGRRTA